MKARMAAVLIGAGLLGACATVARVTLEDRFQAIGLPEGAAVCMVDDLDQRLSDEDLQYLARYTLQLSRADTALGAVHALMTIDRPGIVAAVGRAGLTCVTGLGRQ